jgi:hypothetical protein
MPAREFGKHRQRTGRTFAVTLALVLKFSGTLVTVETGPGTLLLTLIVVMLRIRLHVTPGTVCVYVFFVSLKKTKNIKT